MPFSRHYGFRQSYLLGLLGCIVANGLIVGGLLTTAKESVSRHVFCGVSAVFLLAAFELGVGVPYYPLATRAFEARFRDRGMVFVIITESLTSMVMNFSYPVVVDAFDEKDTGKKSLCNLLLCVLR